MDRICMVLASFWIPLQDSLKITDIWVPEVIENGTESSAVLDCVYELNEEDMDFLEIKWYFRFDETPIYQWIPPGPPQVPSHMKSFINTGYRATSNPLTMHRALHLKNLSSKLSGRYSCRVSSNYDDDFKSETMIIYERPHKMKLHVEYPALSWEPNLNVSCSAFKVYPEPDVRIIIIDEYSNRFDFSEASTRSLVWKEGSYQIIVSKEIPLTEIAALMPQRARFPKTKIIVCELTIPGTNVNEIRQEPFLENGKEHQVLPASSYSNCSTSLKRLCLGNKLWIYFNTIILIIINKIKIKLLRTHL